MGLFRIFCFRPRSSIFDDFRWSTDTKTSTRFFSSKEKASHKCEAQSRLLLGLRERFCGERGDRRGHFGNLRDASRAPARSAYPVAPVTPAFPSARHQSGVVNPLAVARAPPGRIPKVEGNVREAGKTLLARRAKPKLRNRPRGTRSWKPDSLIPFVKEGKLRKRSTGSLATLYYLSNFSLGLWSRWC